MSRTTDFKISEFTAELTREYGRWLSYPEAAEAVAASVRTLKRFTAQGDLPAYKIGRARVLRLKASDVAALIERVA